jgi:hypothetical protein
MRIVGHGRRCLPMPASLCPARTVAARARRTGFRPWAAPRTTAWRWRRWIGQCSESVCFLELVGCHSLAMLPEEHAREVARARARTGRWRRLSGSGHEDEQRQRDDQQRQRTVWRALRSPNGPK